MSQAIAAKRGTTHPHLIRASEPAQLGEDEVLCRTLQLGICGTDRDILHSANPWLPSGEESLVLGHECLALVEATGSDVTDCRVGDLVVPVVRRATRSFARRVDMLPFGDTFVERGIYREHGFSSPRWIDRPQFLYTVPPAIAKIAVFTEPLAVAEKGVNEALVIQQARLDPTAWTSPPPRVLVTGMGPIGFAAVLACVARNWPVTMAGRDSASTFRAQLVQECGATYRNMQELDIDAADIERDGYDLVLECTGSDNVTLLAARHLASCGVMAWLGSMRVPEAASHNVQRFMRDGLVRNHVYIGCVNAAPRDFHDALKHLELLNARSPKLVPQLFTRHVSLADSLWHYENREPQGIKTVVEYS